MHPNKKSATYLPASIKDLDTKKGIVTGYFANFNSLDSDNDIIMPGAFAKTITERGPKSSRPRIKYLLDHDTSKAVGVLTDLSEDAVGLRYEAQSGSHNLGLDFVRMVDSGLITEHSFGYSTIRKEVINPDGEWRDQQRRLIELQMWEGSPLQTWGANENTPLTGLKGKIKMHERIELLIKELRSGTYTDETFGNLEKELIFLQKAIESDYDFTSPEPETMATTTPNDEGKMLNEIQIMRTRLAFIH